ncbi:toprim domain-containing protein [Thermogemmatispora carboxidivorans]|uniref:toprim domain-containing protein n=1 Tax=Thermogemmatispora carboxidivorans TaxID=1382306 RepID=UPI000699D8B2|nr:toprim domain-containing protein [Thermogemmatispora carboxidivorans]
MRDADELEDFKRRVNLVELAHSYGYVVSRKESCRTSMVLRHATEHSKLVVATGQDGHGIFFEVHSDASGSVIDFVMYRENCSLGQARVKLREWLGQPRLNLEIRDYARQKPVPVRRDRLASAVAWERAQPYSGGYLEGRGLTAETIARFSDHIRLIASPDGKHRNVAFRHDDQDGLSGWEVKNRGFTGFAGGGGKKLFSCLIGEEGPPTRIVICESAIDAMSYHQLSGKPGLYVSFAGGISDAQKDLLRKLLIANPQAEVVSATDADAQGEQYAVFINSIRSDAIRDRPGRRGHSGERFKDWNDVLMERQAPATIKKAGKPHQEEQQTAPEIALQLMPARPGHAPPSPKIGR